MLRAAVRLADPALTIAAMALRVSVVILGTQKCLELDDLQTPAAFLTTAL